MRSFLLAALIGALLLPSSVVAQNQNIPARLQEMWEGAKMNEDARYAVIVENLETGQRLVEINPAVPMKPASLTKLFTGAAALEELGADRRFYTTVEIEGAIDAEGMLSGDVIIRGGGDPGLGPRYQVDKTQVTKVMNDWAEIVKRAGIRKIDGDIIGDDSFFANDRWGPGWYEDEKGEWYMAEISALVFNDACIDVTFRGDKSPGDKAKIVTKAPDTQYYDVRNEVTTVERGRSAGNIAFARHENNRTFVATGRLHPEAERTRWAAVYDPAAYTAQVFREELEEEEVKVTGAAFSRHRQAGTGEAAGGSAQILHRQYSAPFADILVTILANSQNLYAETAGRHLARETGRVSTFEGACAAVTAWAEANDLTSNGFLLMDVSGLSPFNRIPARSVAAILRHMSQHSEYELYRDAMARPNARGSLRSRLKPVAGRIDAKSGTLGDTNGVAGYLTSRSGTDYIIVVMNDTVRVSGGQDLVDNMIEEIDRMLP